MIPLDLWNTEPEQRATEHRVVIGTPALVGLQIQPIVPQLFAASIASRLGISMPAASGQFTIPRLATSLTAGFVAEGADGAETAATFDSLSTNAKRLSGGFATRLETLANVGYAAEFEASLKSNLQLVLSDVLYRAIVRSDGTSNTPKRTHLSDW